MAASTNDATATTWSTRDRSWLVPWVNASVRGQALRKIDINQNRRLRHLQSISLRNLDYSATDHRPRGKSNDDDVLPGTLRSPAKQLALRETKTLGHSRSSDNLRPIHESAKDDAKSDQGTTVPKDKRVRPSKKLRRRSTLDWASASSLLRQQTLEAVSAARLADVFFSLHLPGIDQPIYVSEVAEQTMNPDFQRIDISNCGTWAGREEHVTVKVWVRRAQSEQFKVLLELSLDLRSLQYLGKDLATFTHPLPHNAVIFELRDGYYTCFTDAQVVEPADPFASARGRPQSPRSVLSASFDALLRLSKLDDSIQDALSLRERLSTDLAALVSANQQPLQNNGREKGTKDFVKTINYAKSTVERQLRSMRQNRDNRIEAVQKRRELLEKGRSDCEDGTTNISSDQEIIDQTREDIQTTARAILNQKRRISADLGRVYPLEPLPNKSLSFSIRGLHLPDSEELDHAPPDVVAAALGYAAHMLQLITFYLDQALPYPCQSRGSTSSITDPISELKAASSSSVSTTNQHTKRKDEFSVSVPSNPLALLDPLRTFPLFSRNSGPKYRFDYGLFLLNKDIQVLLSNAYGVRVLDIRHTLPNLMYILACMGAGEGELPARKAGGVRGLIRGDTGRDESSHSIGSGNGIKVEREWRVQAEEQGLGRASSFKPGSARMNKGINGRGSTGIAEQDWEGILKGDPRSLKRGAAIAGAKSG